MITIRINNSNHFMSPGLLLTTGFPTATGSRALTKTCAALSSPITATSSVQASRSGPAFTPAAVQTARVRSYTLRIEIVRVERSPRNAAFNVPLAAHRQQRFVRCDAPAIGIAVIKIFKGERVRQHCSVARRDLVDVSVGVGEETANVGRPMAEAHGDVDPGRR